MGLLFCVGWLILPSMKKTEAIQLAGSQCDLAKLLGITQAAVSQWGENVPMARLWQMKTLKPEWFDGQAVTINPQT